MTGVLRVSHRDRMTTGEESDPELTPDEQLMLEIGWLDLWHADREAGRPADELGDGD